MSSATFRTTSQEVLLKDLQEAYKRLQELGFKRSSNQLKDVREIRELKRNIARMKTVLQERKHEAVKTE